MTVKVAHRALETSETAGTGTLNLAGPSSGFQSLEAAAIEISGSGTGPWRVDYMITDGVDWETGTGTLTAGSPDTLARTSVRASSNGDAAVNWGSGTKQVFIWPNARDLSRLLDDQLGRGFLVRAASGVYGVAALTAGNGITVTKGSGHSGATVANPIIAARIISSAGLHASTTGLRLDYANVPAATVVAGDIFTFRDVSATGAGRVRRTTLAGMAQTGGGIVAKASQGLRFEVSALGGSTGAVATTDLVPVQTPGGTTRYERKSKIGGGFDTALFHIREQQPQGSTGRTAVGGAWNDRPHNTVVTNQITGASLGASGAFTLPTGTYYINALGYARQVGFHKLRLRVPAAASTKLHGLNSDHHSNASDVVATHAFLRGRFTIASATVFKLQHFTTTGGAGRMGTPANASGAPEIYSEAEIYKVG